MLGGQNRTGVVFTREIAASDSPNAPWWVGLTPGGINLFTVNMGGPILNSPALVPQFGVPGAYFLYFGTEGTPIAPGSLFEFDTATLAAVGFGYGVPGGGGPFSSFTTSSAAVDGGGSVIIGTSDGSLVIWP